MKENSSFDFNFNLQAYEVYDWYNPDKKVYGKWNTTLKGGTRLEIVIDTKNLTACITRSVLYVMGMYEPPFGTIDGWSIKSTIHKK